jgi:hypothetical protein
LEFTHKYGRLPNDPDKPRLKLGDYFTPSFPLPGEADWHSKVAGQWGMYLNDTIGDCTCAEVCHQILSESAYGGSGLLRLSDQDCLNAYCAVSGYDPATGANDNGAAIQNVLGYWRGTGFGGHKCVAFAEADVQDMNAIKYGVATFGSLDLGLLVPQVMEQQFAAGLPFRLTDDDGQILGGHSIELVGYDVHGWLYVVTWGRVVRMSIPFFLKYVEEAWAVILPQWLNRVGADPLGVNLRGLESDLSDLTHARVPLLTRHLDFAACGR